jgi:hypothetical protein
MRSPPEVQYKKIEEENTAVVIIAKHTVQKYPFQLNARRLNMLKTGGKSRNEKAVFNRERRTGGMNIVMHRKNQTRRESLMERSLRLKDGSSTAKELMRFIALRTVE